MKIIENTHTHTQSGEEYFMNYVQCCKTDFSFISMRNWLQHANLKSEDSPVVLNDAGNTVCITIES